MLNYTYDDKAKVLTITAQVDPDNLQPSKSGDSLVVATSRGNIRTNILIKGKPLTFGFNAYISNK